MDDAKLLLQIDDLLELDPGTLKGPEQLDSLESWNSLAVIGYMALVNDETGKIVSPKQISACVTVNDLVRLVSSS